MKRDVAKLSLSFFLALIFFCASFHVAGAYNQQSDNVSAGPFDISLLWGGALGGGSEIQTISANHKVDMIQGDYDVQIGEDIDFSYSADDPYYSLGGGLLVPDRNADGTWVGDISSYSGCPDSGPSYDLGVPGVYSFRLCGIQPNVSMSSDNSSVITCSGMDCTAVGSGTAQLTASIGSTSLNSWGNNPTYDPNYWPVVNATLSSTSVSWPVNVYAIPTVTLTADSTSLPYNTATNLNWSSTDATSCTASGSWNGAKAVSGTESTGNLTSSKTYILTCDGLGGSSTPSSVTVLVGPPTTQPTLNFTADDTIVPPDTATNLNWSSTNTTSCTASGDWSGSKALSGTESTGNLTVDQTYILDCTGPGGTIQRIVTVTVGIVPDPPPTLVFTADSTSLPYNGSTNLNWTSTNATSCTASGDWSGSKALSGTESTGNLTSSRTYILACNGPGGNITIPVFIYVDPLPPDVPTVTLTADSIGIPYDTATNLNWSSTDATSCTASGDWSGSKALSGTQSTGNLTADSTYTITCTGPGGTDSSTVSIIVGPPSPPTLVFTADSSSLPYNGSTNLNWTSTNATSCTASGDWSGSKALSGTENTGNLNASMTYILDCIGPGGNISQSLIIIVGPPPPLPTLAFTADSTSLPYNGSTNLNWSSTDATSCTASGDWSGSKGLSGTQSTGSLDVSMTYILTCSNIIGSDVQAVVITVADPPAPIINSFTSDRYDTGYNGDPRIYWDTTYASACTIDYGSVNFGPWSYVIPAEVLNSGSYRFYNFQETTTFTLTCSNVTGTVNASLVVNIGTHLHFNTDQTIPKGATASFNWDVWNADTCTPADGTASWTSADLTPSMPFSSGSFTTEPLFVTTDYTLDCSNATSAYTNPDTDTVYIIPDPVISFWATDPFLPYGGSTDLNWVASYVNFCTATNGPASWMASPDKGVAGGSLNVTGSENTGQLWSNTTYELTCVGPSGTAIATVTVVVGSPPPGPTLTFYALPDTVNYGGSSTLYWSTTDANSCAPIAGSAEWLLSGILATSGNWGTGPLMATTTYTIQCTGYSGTVSGSATVTVGVYVPVIVDLSAGSYNLAYGGSTDISWTSSNADWCWVDGTPQQFPGGDGNVSSSGSVNTGSMTITNSYVIVCGRWADGETATDNILISVDPPPLPTLSFTADDTTLPYNGSTNLNWSSNYADSCTASGDWAGTKELSDSESTGNLIFDVIYVLTCSNSTGNVVQSVSIDVGLPSPPTLSFTADSYNISYNTSTNLNWSSTDAAACNALGAWSGSKPLSGSQNTGNLTSNRTYALTCTGPGGSIGRAVTITVNPPPQPVLLSFNADSTSIPYDTATNLNWTSTNATSCTAFGDWSGSKGLSGTENTGNLTSDRAYTLKCSGPGGSNTQAVSINVGDPVQPTPTISFWADSYSIPVGTATTLRWTSTNVDTCIASLDWNGLRATSGDASTGNINSDKMYILTCSGPYGAVGMLVNIVVGGSFEPVPTLSFWPDSDNIPYNTTTTLNWASTNTDSCVASGDWNGNRGLTGSENTLNLTSSRTFNLTCSGPGGSITIVVVVAVGASADPPPTLFISTDDAYGVGDVIPYNTATNIIWMSTNATSCTASGDWNGGKALTGSENTGNLTGIRYYTLACIGPGGGISQNFSIDVSKLIVCRPTVTLTITGNSFLRAYYIERLSDNPVFDCDNTGGSVEVTADSNTDWITENSAYVSVNNGAFKGRITGNQQTESSVPNNIIDITASYDYAGEGDYITNMAQVTVAGAICGDGIVNQGGEVCDDGVLNGDCPAVCSGGVISAGGCQINDCRKTTNWIEVAP